VKALGGGGGALGAVGLQNGLAIEFDTYRNGAPYFDIANDHSQFLHTDPTHNHAGNGGNIGIGNQTDLGNIHDGHWHNVLVTWNPENTTLTYWFDGKQAGQMTTDIRTQHLGDNFAYLSLTGAGGGSSNVQEVRVDQLSALWEGEVHTSNGVHAHA
jgi:Bacterial lectin